jgi:hypothetical protein
LSKGFPSLLRDVNKLLDEALREGDRCGHAIVVAKRPLWLCDRCRFIFRALSAMMRAEDEREEYAATFAPIFKTDIGLGR